MAKRAHKLDRMRVAAPCSQDWEQMRGNDRVRYCDACQKRVYNLSALTRGEAEALVESAPGKLCVRFESRADGTIATRDEAAGLSGLRWRLPRVASAVISAALSLSVTAAVPVRSSGAVVSPQKQKSKKPGAQIQTPQAPASFTGVVYDPIRAVIVNALVRMTHAQTKLEYQTTSSDDGSFRFAELPPGLYTMNIESPGFVRYQNAELFLSPGEELRFDVVLRVATMGGAAFLPEDTGRVPLPQAILRKLSSLFS